MNLVRAWKLLFLLTLFCLCGSRAAMAEHYSGEQKDDQKDGTGRTITIVADEWCPLTCKDTDKKQGILVDITREALARYGVRVEYKTLPWSRAIVDTRLGKYSAIVGASPEEAPDFIYPALPQAVSHLAFYTLTENAWIYDHNEKNVLDKISFGAVVDYSYNKEIDEYITKHKKTSSKVQLLQGENALEMNIKKLLAGRIGAILEEDLVIRKYLEEHNLSEKIHRAGVLPEGISNYLFVAFSPHENEAKQYSLFLDQEMLRMLYSGRITEIMSEYNVR